MTPHNKFLLLSTLIVVCTFVVIAINALNNQREVYVPEPVLSKCDSIIFANDSLIQRNAMLESRLLTYTLGLAQLKMVDKEAHDYLINAGNFKFIERW
jgi:hypothetical protein